MTGSSKKDESIVKFGRSAERVPAEKEVVAPKAIREFMFGAPLRSM